MTLMKAWFVGFDLATLFLVIRLLRFTGRPFGLSLMYAWCPLVIKEIGNSGHLDASAIFLATLAIYVAVSALFRPTNWLLAAALDTTTRSRPARSQASEPRCTHRVSMGYSMTGCGQNSWSRTWHGSRRVDRSPAQLGACGAKLYPIVFLPLFVLSIQKKLGWKCAFTSSLVFAAVLVPVAWPMLPRPSPVTQSTDFDPAQVVPQTDNAPPVPPQDVSTAPRDPSESLKAFLGEWEMNDFLFLIVIENLRPTADLPVGKVAWFSILPERWRLNIIQHTGRFLGMDAGRVPFVVARAITSAGFILLACWLSWKASLSEEPTRWLSAAFLTVAWFWLLLPTQNPWYWTWAALPLLPISARRRAWLFMSGLAFVYNFRFWLSHHLAVTPLLGTGYTGPLFFDYVVTWLEFAPWFAVLIATSLWSTAPDPTHARRVRFPK